MTVDEGREVDIIYLKFSKAFDIVSNNILVSQLGWMLWSVWLKNHWFGSEENG